MQGKLRLSGLDCSDVLYDLYCRDFYLLLRNVFKVVELLIQHGIPHNVVIMRGKHFTEESEVVRVVVFPKQPAKGTDQVTRTLKLSVYAHAGAKKLIDDGDQGLPAFVVAAMEVIGFVVVVGRCDCVCLNQGYIIYIA